MDKKKVLDALNEALSQEYSTVIKFLTLSAVVKGLEAEPLRKLLKSKAGDELNHAAELTDRIVAMGGTPTTSVAKISISTDIKQILSYAVKQEQNLVDIYQKIMKLTPKSENILLYETMEHLLEDELKDLEEFQRLAG